MLNQIIYSRRYELGGVSPKMSEYQTQAPEKELEQKRILIAEDENDLLFLFSTYLSSWGVKTNLAESGNKALNYFGDSKEKGRPYDAILLDTRSVNPSGLDVAKRIRSEKLDQKLVLVTTTPKENLSKDV